MSLAMESTGETVYPCPFDYNDSPAPDRVQEYYEISSNRSHIFVPVSASLTSASEGPAPQDMYSRRVSTSETGAMASRNVGWDAFKLQSVEAHNRCDKVFFNVFLQVSKVTAYGLVFLLILASGILSKLCMILLASNLFTFPASSLSDRSGCAESTGNKTVHTTSGSTEDNKERYLAVIWSICFSLLLPEILTWISCFRKVMLRQIHGPQSAITWALAFLSETLHTTGVLLFLYDVSATTDLVSALMLTSAFSFLPSLLALLNRRSSDSYFIFRLITDLAAFLCQSTALFFWPLLIPSTFRWTLPVSLILISFRWWENYVSLDSPFSFVRWLAQYRSNIGQAQCKVYLFVSLWKIVLILAWMATWHAVTATYDLNIFDIRNVYTGSSTVDLGGKVVNGTWVERRQRLWFWKPNAVFLLLALTGAAAGFVGSVCAKYACRVKIHVFSFAIPTCLVPVAAVATAASVCESLRTNACSMDSILPEIIHFRCPPFPSFWSMLETQYAWLWFLWLVSHWVITMHMWKSKTEHRKTNHLFSLPDFGLFPVDVTSSLNRMRYSVENFHRMHFTSQDPSYCLTPRTKDKKKQQTAHLYICSFFDRQTENDVVECIKSVLRMDEEQCARRNALRFLIESDPDYFEFEGHFFFENAFSMDTVRGERVLDKFLARLIITFQEAAASVHEFPINVRPPKKLTTSYGAQVQWTLPGGNRCTAHFKDPGLTRAGERWSQVMALYYILGHKIMQMPTILERKENYANSSYVLMTSGTVRYKPQAVTKLLSIIKQGSHIGAVTCRLRPVGTGPLVWYQMYEYAMRYWMDRATEHMLGSLLRIRTGFTMFRVAALMDDNVVKKFAMIPEDSKEFMQFRLGNEQWLCSLLLKQGYKVEYCAATDVPIHVPETFSNYLRETQREYPLQLAAMSDITSDYSGVLERNENITIMYIFYLMMALVSTIFVPGTIFLVIVTSLVSLFKMNMFAALASNLAPVAVLMTVCAFGSKKLQHLCIKILSAVYGLIMLAVLISATVQLHQSWLSASPVSIFMLAFLLSTLLPAIFHPQEMYNILFAPVYFIAIPSLYILSVIHALSTFHVANTPRPKPNTEDQDLAEQIKKWEELAKEAQADPNKTALEKIPSIDVIEELKKYLPNGKKSVTFACGSFCGIVCCPPPDESPLEGPFGDLIGRELLQLGRKLHMIESRLRARRMGLQGFRPRARLPDGLGMPLTVGPQLDWDQISEASANYSVSTVRTAVKSTEEFHEKFGGRNLNNDKLTEWLLSLTDPAAATHIENDNWMDEEDLASAEPEILDPAEATFWRELIATYLVPLTGNSAGLEEAMVEQMKKLRNKVGLGFLMVNGLFVLMVFLLELRREDLFILLPSPFSSSQKRTAIQIEPTGIAFLLFFFGLMLVQFIAMLMHRWGTFSHLLASTELTCCTGKKRIGFDYLRDNAVQIARELQSMKNTKDFDAETGATTIDNRKNKGAVSTLDIVFRKRFAALQRTVDQPEPGTATTTLHRQPFSRTGRASKRTLDSRKGISREPGDKPHAAEVFQISRGNGDSGNEQGSSRSSTTSF